MLSDFEALVNRYRTGCNRPIVTRRENVTDFFFKKFGYCYIAGEYHKSGLESLKIKKTEQIIDLYNKPCGNDSFGGKDMSWWRAARLEGFCVADCPSKLEAYSTDVNPTFNGEPAKEAYKNLKKFKISKIGYAAA